MTAVNVTHKPRQPIFSVLNHRRVLDDPDHCAIHAVRVISR